MGLPYWLHSFSPITCNWPFLATGVCARVCARHQQAKPYKTYCLQETMDSFFHEDSFNDERLMMSKGFNDVLNVRVCPASPEPVPLSAGTEPCQSRLKGGSPFRACPLYGGRLTLVDQR